MAKQLTYTITGDSRDFQRAITGAQRSADGLHGPLGRLNKAGGAMGRGLAVGAKVGTAGLAALGFGAFKAFTAFEESRKVVKQTEAVLKSTGGTAGLTAKQVSSLATAISNKTAIDDEAIQSGENLLLTFTNIRNETGKGNDIFSQTTALMADMSVALGQDTKSSAMQLGKALNDPVKGVTALQRVGVSFTESQKEQIKTLVDSGKAMDAQKLILAELTKEFGGSAAAAATPLDKLKVRLGNLMETLGGALAPAIQKAAGFLNQFIKQIGSGEGPGGKFASVMRDVGQVIVTIGKAAVAAWPVILRVGEQVFNGVKNAVMSVKDAITGFVQRNRGDIQAFLSAIQNAGSVVQHIFGDLILPVIRRILPGIRQVFQGAITVIRGAVRIISGILTLDFGKAWDGVRDIFSGALKMLGGVIRAGTAPLRAAASAIGSAIKTGIMAVVNTIGGPFKAVFHTLKSVVGDVVQFIRDRLADVLSVWESVVRAFSGIPGIGSRFESLADSIDQAKDALRGMDESADLSNVTRVVQNVQAAIQSVLATIDAMRAKLAAPLPTPSGGGGGGGGGGGQSPPAPVTEKASVSALSPSSLGYGRGGALAVANARRAITGLSKSRGDDLIALNMQESILAKQLKKARAGKGVGKLEKLLRGARKAGHDQQASVLSERLNFFSAENVEQLAGQVGGVRSERQSIKQEQRREERDRKQKQREKDKAAAERRRIRKPNSFETLNAALSFAALDNTDDPATLANDRDALVTLQTKYTKLLNKAVRSGDPRKVQEFADALKGITDQITAIDEAVAQPDTQAADELQAAIEAQTAAVEAQTAATQALVDAQAADTALRERIFGTQTGAVLAGIADMVSGQIGGRIGLGIQTPSFAGGRSRY